tara:strand:- start:1089 stop:1316 length:228 start_codon:yes stop_codon:yes gene_type:complete
MNEVVENTEEVEVPTVDGIPLTELGDVATHLYNKIVSIRAELVEYDTKAKAKLGALEEVYADLRVIVEANVAKKA